jgi:hypothetical protein
MRENSKKIRSAWHLISAWLALIALLMFSSLASAQSIEGVLMPGPVIEGHAKAEADCRACHIPFNRAAQDKLCQECHKEVATDIRDKRGYHGRMKQQTCRTCHTDHKGRAAKIVVLDEKTFDHEQTDFVLRGAHANTKVECKSCHLAGKKHREAPSDCYACHKKDDVHKGLLGTKCGDCHTEKNWKEVRFDHDKTRFLLRGKHAPLKCESCHKDNKFKDTPMTCIACHKKDDSHKGKYGEKCETCHTDQAWKPSKFNHDRDTKFTLRGKHKEAKCETCHTGHLYKDKLQSTCIACHKKDDKHEGTQGTACGDCHGESSWKIPKFDHSKTRFPLNGKHAEVKCESCHKSTRFKDAPMTCIGCHKKDDVHKGTMSEKCADCHNEKSWKIPKFDHSKTRFPLRFKHAEAKCEACHKSQRYKEAPSNCVGCHKKDDSHKGTLGEACQDCHTERSWKEGRFDHDKTRFPLVGKHKTAKCTDCHKDKNYRETPSQCYACHKKDDVHQEQLGRECQQCHSSENWKKTKFDHNKTKFPLLGKHIPVACEKCHVTKRYRDAKSECVSCHLRDDVHKKRLGPQCDTCHNSRDWKLWDFNHDRRTEFILDGAHKKLNCYACHRVATDKKPTLPKSCVSCHAGDDVHDGSFGRQCEKCHVTSSFKQIKQRIGAMHEGCETVADLACGSVYAPDREFTGLTTFLQAGSR